MYCLYPNRITAVEADLEDAGYPAEFVLDEHPELPYKSTGPTATFKATVTDAAGKAAISSTNATTVTVTVWNEGETEILWGPETYDMTGIYDFFTFFTDTGEPLDRLEVDYGEIWDTHVIVWEFTSPSGTVVQVGEMAAAIPFDVGDPVYGLDSGLHERAVEDEHANGAGYYELLGIDEEWDVEVDMDRDAVYFRLIRQIVKKIGKKPIFWNFVKDGTTNWLAFAKIVSLPKGSHDKVLTTNTKIKFREVV